jgi:hypothetical protein
VIAVLISAKKCLNSDFFVCYLHLYFLEWSTAKKVTEKHKIGGKALYKSELKNLAACIGSTVSNNFGVCSFAGMDYYIPYTRIQNGHVSLEQSLLREFTYTEG